MDNLAKKLDLRIIKIPWIWWEKVSSGNIERLKIKYDLIKEIVEKVLNFIVSQSNNFRIIKYNLDRIQGFKI
jgi:hypothetical protein